MTTTAIRSMPSVAADRSDDAARALPVLPEPVHLLQQLRAMAAVDPAAARATAPDMLARHAAALWAPELSSQGGSADAVTEAFETLRREIWLWIDGDRRWDQLATHFGARVQRRWLAAIG